VLLSGKPAAATSLGRWSPTFGTWVTAIQERSNFTSAQAKRNHSIWGNPSGSSALPRKIWGNPCGDFGVTPVENSA